MRVSVRLKSAALRIGLVNRLYQRYVRFRDLPGDLDRLGEMVRLQTLSLMVTRNEPMGALERARKDGTFWGTGSRYFDPAERDMDRQWNEIVWPFINVSDADFSVILDLAAGRGRNTAILRKLDGNRRVLAIDIDTANVEFCRQRFAGDPNVICAQNDGAKLESVEDSSITFLYCFDAMVHFDPAVVLSYVKEFNRVLVPGGYGFCHHSNYTDQGIRYFMTNPGSRNYMSKDLFAAFLSRNRLDVVKQRVLDWGGTRSLDCLTLFRKPGAKAC